MLIQNTLAVRLISDREPLVFESSFSFFCLSKKKAKNPIRWKNCSFDMANGYRFNILEDECLMEHKSNPMKINDQSYAQGISLQFLTRSKNKLMKWPSHEHQIETCRNGNEWWTKEKYFVAMENVYLTTKLHRLPCFILLHFKLIFTNNL